jgi:uncharacterized protein
VTFLQPWWWLLLLLAVPLVLWQGRRPRSVQVASLRIWRLAGAAVETTHTRARRLRMTLPLALLLAALFCLTLALTGLRPAGAVVDHHVVVVDRSASMASADGEATRFDAAVDFARSRLGATPPRARGGSRVSLVTVGPEVRVEVARHDTARDAMAVLAELRPSSSPDAIPWRRVGQAIAGLDAANDERTHVTVVTDGAGATAARDALVAEGRGLVVHAFGEGVASTGLSAVRATLLDEDAGRWRIEGDVVAHPPRDDEILIDVRFERADIEGLLPWTETRVQLEGERTPFAFETTVPGEGLVSLQLPADAFTPDDVARSYLRASPVPLRISLHGTVPAGLREALAALDGARLIVEPDPAEPSEAGEDGGEGMGALVDLAVVGAGADGAAPAAPTVLWLAGAGPSGPYPVRTSAPEWLAPGPGTTGFSAVEDAQDDAIVRAYEVPSLDGAATLLEGSDGPLLQVRRAGARTDVVAGWDLGATSWRRELGFVTFVSELGREARPRHGAWTATRCIAGRMCEPARGGIAPDGPLGLREGGGTLWIVDGEGGPESDLRASGEGPPEGRSAFPWDRLDRGLALLAAALLAAEGVWAWLRTRGVRRSGRRTLRLAARGARIAAVAALVALAAGLPFPVPAAEPAPVLVVEPGVGTDAGGSDVPGSAAETPRATTVRAERFGTLAASERAPDAGDGTAAPTLGYDAAAVVRTAAAASADAGRVLLAGVGRDEIVGVQRIADELAARGVVLDAMTAQATPDDEAWLDALWLPERVRSGETVPIRAWVGGPAAGDRGVRVTVDGDDVGTIEPASVRGGGGLDVDAGEPGTRVVRAELVDAPVGMAANDARTAVLRVEEPGRVVVVTSEDRDPDDAVERLGVEGFELDGWRASRLPVDVEDLLETDVVVLLDVPAVDLHRRQQEALERWVRDYGGGVLIAGAERAYGPGGYFRTPLETLSPLSARVPGEQPQAAVAFVIDRSGSMQQTTAGISRMAVAKEATISAVELLHPASRVAVVVFDDVATTLRPLGPLEGLGPVLAPVRPGGGTNLYPAIDAAYAQLVDAEAEAKHMVVLTDGLAQAAPFGELTERVAAADITISTVAIGRGAGRTLLQGIARSASGVFHEADDVRALPSILAQEAMLLSGSPVREGDVTPTFEPGSAAFLEDLGEAFPTVGGWVRTTPKPEADIHALTPGGDPILGSWRHGVGRVVGLATPLTGAWAEDWTSEPFAEALVPQVLRWLLPPIVEPGLTLGVGRAADDLVVEARVVDQEGRSVEGARIDAEVRGPGWPSVEVVPLADAGMGRYLARVPAHDPGRYEVRGMPRDARSVDAGLEARGAIHVSFPQHLAPRGAGPGRGVLALVEATGGSVLSPGDRSSGAGGFRWRAALAPAPWAVAAIVLTVLGMVAASVRRFGRNASWSGETPAGDPPSPASAASQAGRGAGA